MYSPWAAAAFAAARLMKFFCASTSFSRLPFHALKAEQQNQTPDSTLAREREIAALNLMLATLGRSWTSTPTDILLDRPADSFHSSSSSHPLRIDLHWGKPRKENADLHASVTERRRPTIPAKAGGQVRLNAVIVASAETLEERRGLLASLE